jgi:hypothetical protein
MSPPMEWWHVASPYLDRALEMQDDERELWLASLAAEDPSLAELLRRLLEEQRALAAEHFLEQPPVELLGRIASAGLSIGSYRLLSPIGSGGMGSVWLAERCDGRFERRAAVKFLNLHSPAAAHRNDLRVKEEFSAGCAIRESRNCWMQASPRTGSLT